MGLNGVLLRVRCTGDGCGEASGRCTMDGGQLPYQGDFKELVLRPGATKSAAWGLCLGQGLGLGLGLARSH